MPLPPLTARQTAVRLFWTCWLVYGLHFATNVVRDVYLAMAIGDELSFRVDEYAGLHPDLFEHPGRGWHTGANPGVSMIGAIPYAAARPAIDLVVDRVNRARREAGVSEPPPYDSPWPLARELYRKAWRRGLDVKLGLAALVMQAGAMAPLSAAGVVLMFFFLRRILQFERQAFLLALLYAFATPVLFRTGTLNHNVLVGHAAFAAFCLLYPLQEAISASRRELLAGVLAGLCVLLDYSGVFVAGPLALFALSQARRQGRPALRAVGRFAAGATGPILLLWWYQWRSFGHPFYPPQTWMPPLEWIEETGFRGLNPPRWRWAWRLWLDPAYGLLTSCPLLALALWPGPAARRLGLAPALLLYGCVAALWLFLSGLDYNAIQANTGVRYMAPVIPLMFVAAACAWIQTPRELAAPLAASSLFLSWCLAMYRDVERALGALGPVADLAASGPALPAVTTLSRLPGPWTPYVAPPWTAIAAYAAAALVAWAIWRARPRP